MVGTREKSDVTWPYKTVVACARKWGWTFVSEGVKEAKFKKDHKGHTEYQTLRRTETIDAYNGGIVRMAMLEDLTVEKWMEGPPERKRETLTDDDLNFFISTDSTSKDSQTSRYKRIRDSLEKDGTLKRYIQIREQRTKAEVSVTSTAPPKTLEPLPVDVDPEGYISLDEALAMVDRKQNVLNRTACELIACLSEGDVFNKSGSATRDIMSKLLHPPQNTGSISGMLAEFADKGLVWRETNGKRTFKVGLCLPTRLTLAEKDKYLKLVPVVDGPQPSPQPVVEPVHEVVHEPVEEPVQPVDDASTFRETVITVGTDEAITADYAAELLRQEIQALDDLIVATIEKKNSLIYAIKVLEGGTVAND